MQLHELPSSKNAKHRKKRVGHGHGSGMGKTSGRGHKGSGSRSGYSVRPTFEGGQMPLARKLGKRGFNNKKFATVYETLNISDLAKVEAEEITPEVLAEAGIIRKADSKVKVLGNGEISKGVKISAHKFTEGAKSKIEAAGGQITQL